MSSNMKVHTCINERKCAVKYATKTIKSWQSKNWGKKNLSHKKIIITVYVQPFFLPVYNFTQYESDLKSRIPL